MSRNKDKSELEHLRGENRELQKVNKALKKRLRQLEKSRHLYQQNKLDETEPTEKVEINSEACPACSIGVQIITDLGIKVLHTCSVCDWRKTSNKHG